MLALLLPPLSGTSGFHWNELIPHKPLQDPILSTKLQLIAHRSLACSRCHHKVHQVLVNTACKKKEGKKRKKPFKGLMFPPRIRGSAGMMGVHLERYLDELNQSIPGSLQLSQT